MHVCAKTTAPPPKVINNSVYLVKSAPYMSAYVIYNSNRLRDPQSAFRFPSSLLQAVQWKFFFYLQNRFSTEHRLETF